MRRLLADRLVLASAVIVVLMSALFAFLRVTGGHAVPRELSTDRGDTVASPPAGSFGEPGAG